MQTNDKEMTKKNTPMDSRPNVARGDSANRPSSESLFHLHYETPATIETFNQRNRTNAYIHLLFLS